MSGSYQSLDRIFREHVLEALVTVSEDLTSVGERLVLQNDAIALKMLNDFLDKRGSFRKIDKPESEKKALKSFRKLVLKRIDSDLGSAVPPPANQLSFLRKLRCRGAAFGGEK